MQRGEWTNPTPPETAPNRPARRLRIVLAALGAGAIAVAQAENLLLGGKRGFGAGQALLCGLGVALWLTCLLSARQIKRVLFAFGATMILLMMVEAGLQLLCGLDFANIHQLDDQYLLKLVPHSVKRSRRIPANGGQAVLVRVNSKGYRGEELREGLGRRRVVVYGDSFILAEFTALEDTFAKRLQAHLATGLGQGIEVVNAGVNGFGPDQIAVRMPAEITTLKPDLLVVAVYSGNDYGDLIRNRLFCIRADGTLQRNATLIGPALRHRFRAAHVPSILYKLFQRAYWRKGPVVDPTGVANVSNTILDTCLEECRAEYQDYAQGRTEAINPLNDHYDADVSMTPDTDSARDKIRLMERVLVVIRDAARNADIPLVLLIIPSPIDVCDEYDLGAVDTRRFPQYRRNTLTGTLAEIAERQGMNYIDLFPRFRQSTDCGLFFKGGDNHWNDVGQDLAAEMTAAYIIDTRLLR